jgi:hypothetical protein
MKEVREREVLVLYRTVIDVGNTRIPLPMPVTRHTSDSVLHALCSRPKQPKKIAEIARLGTDILLSP